MMGWKDLLQEDTQLIDIKGRVAELEKEYKKWDWILTTLIFIGFGLILFSAAGSRTLQNVLLGSGIIVAVSGLVNIGVLKIWMHIKLSTFQLLFELRKAR